MSNSIKEKVWIQYRMDNAFGNAEWFWLFWRSYSTYLEKLVLDHMSIVMSLAAHGQNQTYGFMFDK